MGRFAFLFCIILSGCVSVSDYDQQSYDRAVQLKVDSATVMKLAVEPAEFYSNKIYEIKHKVEYAYEYEKGKGKINVFTIKQYEIMMDSDGGLLYGFLNRWENSERGMNQYFIDESIIIVGQGFDEIIRMEWNKR